ncbi:hypothetical protein ADK70_07570 [Streptomyces rimosus subsp. pseudoverticillatus]|uniref:hypothetical protein n=1 Tax=Streptomyces rimosus TaxID=1927 RepID=UPI0006C26942|nr:hypothetical protein [Streptomyces rimosus]KOT97968.1 hypothetical protein ADK70_07570 [Streptomyces rimosus subsp. pseudoverticillatus]
MNKPQVVYVIEHNKPEQVEDHGALRTVAPACKELALAAFTDIEQAREEAEVWAERQHYPGLTWQESNNPLIGDAVGLTATTEVDGQKTVVFRVSALVVVESRAWSPLSLQRAPRR